MAATIPCEKFKAVLKTWNVYCFGFEKSIIIERVKVGKHIVLKKQFADISERTGIFAVEAGFSYLFLVFIYIYLEG